MAKALNFERYASVLSFTYTHIYIYIIVYTYSKTDSIYLCIDIYQERLFFLRNLYEQASNVAAKNKHF